VEKLAAPLVSEAVPSNDAPSKKLTAPVGVPVVAEVTCAVSVTLVPGVAEALLALSAVVVPACLTVKVPLVTVCV